MPESDPTELEQAITDGATGPQSVSNDGVTVNQRSIDDIIKADRYLAAKEAAAGKKKWRGIGIGFLRFGGTR